jgi:hypothetical protein
MRYFFLVLAMLCVVNSEVSAQKKSCGSVRPTSDKSGTFTSGNLEGRNLADLYAAYIGVRGQVPSRITVDPGRQLDSLWLAKMACFKTATVVKVVHRELLASYRGKRTNVTIDEFISEAETEVRLVRKEMNWEKLGQIYGLSDTKLGLVKMLANQISGKDLVAYGMTEIMPSADGELNVQVLEFLVRNYGKEFVYSIPARHDRYASFGFYQFTSLALYDDGKRKEGASRAGSALSNGKLPGSAMHIRGKLQHRAAYLFSIHNIASLVKRLSSVQTSRLLRLPERNHDDLIQFIAAAHNGPVEAYRAARRWLDAGMKYEYYISVSNGSVRRYASKTKANLSALRNGKKLNGSLYGRR